MLCRKESDQYGRKMAALPRLREQDPLKAAAGHAAYQLPAVLPQVQVEDAGHSGSSLIMDGSADGLCGQQIEKGLKKYP